MRDPSGSAGTTAARIVGLLAVLGAIAGGTGIVQAHEAVFKSAISIDFYDKAAPGAGASQCGDTAGPDCFFGQVTSAHAVCERRREVRVFKVLEGPPPGKRGAFNQLVGSATTGSDGDWVVPVNDPGSGDYFARAARRTIERPGHVHVCRRATSTVRHFSDFG